MLILRTEHGLPLHALGGIEALKGHYVRHLKKDSERREPPHISARWLEDADCLEDVLPAGLTALEESFALGLFTNWLVRTRKHEEAAAIIRHWSNGVVYERTPNQYHVAVLEKHGNTIQVKEERSLAAGRAAAAAAFTQADAAHVKRFMHVLTDRIGADQVRKLIRDYCDNVLEAAVAPRAPHAEHLKEQFRRELDALRSSIGEE